MRLSAAAAFAGGLIVVVALARLASGALSLGPVYVVKAATVFLTMAVVACTRLTAHHPFRRFGLANQITTLRAVLVALVAGFVGEPTNAAVATAAVVTALVATMLDGLDGAAARRTRMASAFGARFDVEIDALLIQVLALLVWRHHKAGAWVLLSGLLRYLFVAAGWIWPWMSRPLPGSVRGKAICVVQIAVLVLALSPLTTPSIAQGLAALGLAALAWSFAVDTRWLWRQD